MRGAYARPTGAALFALWAAAACGAASRGGTETASPPAGASSAEPAEIEAIFRARTDSARTRFTEADVRFMSGMIVHHTQAVVMGRLASTHGAGPSIRTLAARIINAQKDEIATMERWLRDRGRPVPEVRIEGTEMRVVDGPEGVLHMHGMLTAEQMRELDRARGREFDRLFLAFMIQHHRGAVAMVNDLFGTDGAARSQAVFKLASDIHVDQMTEIARMERMLAAWSEGRGP